ncbi:MAG: ATP-binding cassette domain-containing protein, partial [Bacillota bacterium]|nr:ATP-binding cassette domain-containing protein [Bacillota bacterium]
MIEIKKVFRTYRIGNEELTVLNDISLKIGKGEFAAIVGPSGSGKSTLMHLIGGLDRPTKGSILIDGEDISSYRDNKMSRFRNEKVGFVFQAFNLEPALTAIENVMLPLLLAGIPEKLRREKARDMLESLGLGDRLYHRP